MKLSEAIRLGAGLTVSSQYKRPEGACALQAACLAMGLPKEKWPWLDTPESPWAWINNRNTSPVDGSQRRIMEIIWSLNDTHKWTRYQIAEWVATIEPRGEAQSPAEQEAPRALQATQA